MFYRIYCKDTYPYLPTPVGELRPYFEGEWRIRMFDRFLCPSGFTGSFVECSDYLKLWFHGWLEECGQHTAGESSQVNPSHPSLSLQPSAN